MPNSIRQRLFDAIRDRFQGIHQNNGYQTNIGTRCFVWRDLQRTPFEEAELPAFCIRDPDCKYEPRILSQHDFGLAIEVYAASTGAPPEVWARYILADLDRAIGVDRQWRVDGIKLANDTIPDSDSMQVIHAEKRIVGVRKSFLVRFHTRQFDPYTQ